MSLRAHDARYAGEGGKSGELPADDVEPAQHDREEVVEVVRDAAGELPDGFHLLRLAQQIPRRLPAGLVLGLQFARALLDRLFQRLGEGAQLGERALAFGHIDADADHADGRPSRVVEDESARLDPSQFAVARAHDAKFGLQIARARRERVVRSMSTQPWQVFPKDALEPGLIAAVEIRQAVDREELRRQAHRARRAPAIRRCRDRPPPRRKRQELVASRLSASSGVVTLRHATYPPRIRFASAIALSLPKATCRGR